jgi:hypothetical protein
MLSLTEKTESRRGYRRLDDRRRPQPKGLFFRRRLPSIKRTDASILDLGRYGDFIRGFAPGEQSLAMPAAAF